ncbi:MAG TPA: DUF937 domain-containing protein [Sphingomicrobium sp.]|jgi:hypothetical protein|nr:DUF937 domain-containing protein [Sphingomicrobium sp.]
MDIGSLLNQAGGPAAIARELGVDQATVENGAGALLPHVVNGIQTQGLPGGGADTQAADSQAGAIGGSDGLGGILGGLMGGAGGGGALGSLLGGGVGNEVLGHIFGSKEVSRDVAAQASQQSGVDTSVLKKLLPIVAGAVAMHYMNQRSTGGTAAGGGGILGSILGGLQSQ